MPDLFDLRDLDLLEVSVLLGDAVPAVEDSEHNIILKTVEKQEFDDSSWDGAAANWDTADAYCEDSLLDFNEVVGNEEKTKAMCMLPYKKAGSREINRNALRAIVSGRGIPALKKPASVPQGEWDRQLKEAADRVIEWWPEAFEGREAPESIFDVAGKERPMEKEVQKGKRLASRLNARIEEMITDDRARSDIVSDMADAANISSATVNNILAGEIMRPPDSRLRGFARVLDIGFGELQELADSDVGKRLEQLENVTGVEKSVWQRIGDWLNGVDDIEKMEVSMDAQEQQVETAIVEEAAVVEAEVADATLNSVVEETIEEDEAEEIVEGPDIEKMIQKAVETTIAPLRKELEEARAEVAKAKEQATDERELRREQEFVQKAIETFRALPESPQNLATILKRAYDTDAEYGERVEALLKAADNGLHAAGIFKEMGTAGVSSEGNSFMSKVEKKAAQLRESDPALSQEEAFTKAYKDMGREDPVGAQSHVRSRQEQTARA